MTILLFLENLVSVWNRDFVLLNLVFNLQDYVFLMKFQNFNINLIFSFLWSRIPSFTTNSSFTYNLVFLFHVGNESNVVWIRPVATRRHRSDYGLIAMVTSWPRLFISLAWHVMSLLCPYWYTRFSFCKNILYKNIEADKSLIKLIYSTWSARSRQSF